MSEPLRCSLCEQIFNALPPDAVRIGQRAGGFQMYRFPDGSVHNLGLARIGFQKRHKAAVPQEKKV
jgi:hypothetical protein